VLKDRRSEVFLATKFGITPTGTNGSPEHIRESLTTSLKRLGTNYVDLYYMHRMDPKTPVEVTVKALKELVDEGKIKYYGLSECSAETLRRAHSIHPCSAVQIEYSPWTTDIERNGVLDACRELGVSVVAYSPLGRGFLTGKYKTPEDLAEDDWRRHNPRFQNENFYKNLNLVREIEKMAEKNKCNAAQLCLAWVLAQGEEMIPIPGTTSIANLESNVAAANITLSSEDLAVFKTIIDSFPPEGDRYPAAFMKSLNL